MSLPTILVTGGAGFIGSHVNKMLNRAGYQTIILDNFSSGSRETVQHGTLIEGDISDSTLLDTLFQRYPIQAVMHFAAFIDVGESVRDPAKYYLNNVSHTLHLLQKMRQHQIKNLIFSSSAAIFGLPLTPSISEDHPSHPINPYGESKWMVEKILHHFDDAYGLRFCCLRYFNAAGGDPEGRIKYKQKNITNLIPLILRHLKSQTGSLTIFGNDYPTHDGTCIRDYVHIEDLGRAHILSMEKLLSGAPSNCYNLGNSQGYSIKEVIAAAEAVTGLKVKVTEGTRRPGDPSILIANSQKAQQKLGWKPIYSQLETIIDHAWKALL